MNQSSLPDYVTPSPKRMRITWLECFVVLAVVLLLISIFLPSLDRRHGHDPRVSCASRLRQIGQAMLLYANNHNGRYPDRFDELITDLDDDTLAEIFCCPSTNDTKAGGPTTRAVAANLTAGGHLSYVYAAKGLSASASGETVLAYEPLANHGTSANILWGNGRVEIVDAAAARKIIAQVESGTNPPK